MAKIEKWATWLDHGKTVFDILIALGLGKALGAALHTFTRIPSEWITPIWLLASAGTLWVMLKAVKPTLAPTLQTTTSAQAQSLLPVSTTVPVVDFDLKKFINTSYQSQWSADIETRIRIAAHQNSPNDLESFYAKVIGVGLVSYSHDITWAYIFESQILMMTELNRRGGWLPVADARTFYQQAKAANETFYATYSFEQWLEFVKSQQLFIRHPSDMLEITIRGRDFLKYLTHWGRSAGQRRG